MFAGRAAVGTLVMKLCVQVNLRPLGAVTGWSSPNLGGHQSHSSRGSHRCAATIPDAARGSPACQDHVARAPVPVLTAPGTEHAGAETLPGSRAVQPVVPAAVGLPGVLGTAATRSAGDDTADRAQLHPRIVDAAGGAVYAPAVLHRRDRPSTDPAIACGLRNATRPFWWRLPVSTGTDAGDCLGEERDAERRASGQGQ